MPASRSRISRSKPIAAPEAARDREAQQCVPAVERRDAGALVGHVKELRGPYVLVDRRLKRDLYVPLEAIVARDGETLALNVTIDQFDELGWSNPPLLGGRDPDALVAPDHEAVNRDVLAVAGATGRDTPLDTRARAR